MKISVKSMRYNFPFQTGRKFVSREEYSLKISGRSHVISNKIFVKISAPCKSIYLGTDHHASVFFSLLERDRGNLKENEEWLHIDWHEHPDNKPLNGRIFLSPASKLKTVCEYLDWGIWPNVPRYAITVGNFMTAVAHLYPNMTFKFLHDACKNGEKATDRHGMRYSEISPLASWADKAGRTNSRVISLDLDIFGLNSFSIEKSESDLMKEKIIKMAETSKTIMMFTSPSFIDVGVATKRMEEMVQELIG
jgi:hypothetical protein